MTQKTGWWWWEARGEPLYMTVVTSANTIGPKIGKESMVYMCLYWSKALDVEPTGSYTKTK
jgi:hypothetical protein